MAIKEPVPLSVEQLRWRCDERIFDFRTTKELVPLRGIVGQQRAIEAIELGAAIESRGYNIFVMSLLGTGRLTTVKQVLEPIAQRRQKFYDFAYVHNFTNPMMPRLLRFRAGRARQFAHALEETIGFLRTRIAELFREEAFQKSRSAIIQRFRTKEAALLEQFNAQIAPQGFTLGQVTDPDGSTRFELFAIIRGKPYSLDQIAALVGEGKLSERRAQRIVGTYLKLREELVSMTYRGQEMQRAFQQALLDHTRKAAGIIVAAAFDELRARFAEEEAVAEYLDDCQRDLIENIELFSPSFSGTPEAELPDGRSLADKLKEYTVNIIVDNAETRSAPIIIETFPTYTNLFGTIERHYDRQGIVRSDFTMIKAGAVLRADGGYLIVNASDVLSDPQVWQTLRRILLYGKLEIQPPEPSSTALKPELIDVNVKVVMLGDYQTYLALAALEEDFTKMFKIAAEFDYETDRSEKMLQNFARFVARLCEEENVLHARPSGVAALIEWAVERAEDKNKITINFSDVSDVIREASFVAQQHRKRFFDRECVQEALRLRRRRTELQDVKIKSQILQGVLMIDVRGARIGQINGLTVYSTGLISFGKPARITASTGAGNAGIIDIEHEASLGGNIYRKGVLTIPGLLREYFGQRRPLALSASISFEQNYGGIDGDSASLAELYAILSSLARVPLLQSIAVTGSINQKGDVQPVGGVNEKIIGFFEICQQHGLDGSHGVIIPHQNVADLMLPEPLLEAARNGRFRIWAIRHFTEGIPILTGMEAGEMLPDFSYRPGTFLHAVDQRLEELALIARDYARTL
ncbi:MAG: ATP-dependent protease [Candidatus Kapaibacterium sp.]|nr:MAG: ATP-dependent protease [Candidatus Kapabacteria bacterium]